MRFETEQIQLHKKIKNIIALPRFQKIDLLAHALGFQSVLPHQSFVFSQHLLLPSDALHDVVTHDAERGGGALRESLYDNKRRKKIQLGNL